MKKLFTLILLFALFTNVNAQQNNIKINGLALALTNISMQYERSLNGNSSLALGVSYLPERGLPGFATSKDDSKTAEDFEFGGFAITPEYRYYFKGEGPKGLYLAGYFRYSKYTTTAFTFEYDQANNTTGEVKMTGDYSTSVVGVMLGSQWLLGDKWTLDWWIIGAGFGSQEGVYEGTGDFSAQDQIDIQDEVESIDTPGVDVEVETSSTTTKVTISPKFPAFRGFGLCLGYRF